MRSSSARGPTRAGWAKVRAWRDILGSQDIHIIWTTYDTPIPSLDIALRWNVIDKGELLSSHISYNFARCNRYAVSRQCTIETWPRLMAFPVDLQWCICGTVLAEGTGELQHADGTLSYHLAGRYLTLTTEMGEGIDCELCVSAIDAHGKELFTCVELKNSGSEEECGPGKRFFPKPTLELIPCDPLMAIDRWEAVTAPSVQQQLTQALETTMQ